MSIRTIQPITQRFKLNKNIVEELKNLTPEFGFNGLGELVFRRTYSRDNEDWADVVIRVVEGCMSIRKEHFFRNSLNWDDNEWQTYASNMAQSLFTMEWLPPGRGLWMMGTDFTYKRGSMALNNCSATDTKDDLVHSAEWTMDGLMNGVGVGFTTNWRGEAVIPNKEDTEVFVIPDSREGWVESLIRLMCAYINSPKYGTNKFPTFDYSDIRPSGLPIKGFGGTSSGPEPLRQMHERIESYLDAFCSGRLQCKSKTWQEINGEWKEVEIDVDKPYSHTRLIADIFNAIGACVVAGNVRRSAEICLGDVDDDDFINLKNYTLNPERSSIGWMSNNSVVLKADRKYEDFSYIPDMARRICDNGEPGMINLYNIQKYGRFGKEHHDDATLVNPCVTADTWIATTEGSLQVKDLMNKPFNAFVDKEGYECKTGFFHTGYKQVFRLETEEGYELRATSNHKIMTADNVWVELSKLLPGDKIRVHNHNIGLTSKDECLEFKKGWVVGSLYGDGIINHSRERAYLTYWGENRNEMIDIATNFLIKSGISDYKVCDYPEYNKVNIDSTLLFKEANKYIKRGKILTDELEKTNLDFIQGFLRGWFDSKGSVKGDKLNGFSIRLLSSSLDSLKKAQRMCLRVGIYSEIYENCHPEYEKLKPDGNGGMKLQNLSAQHELIINRASLKTYKDVIGFCENYKAQRLDEILSSYNYKRDFYGFRYEATVKNIVLDGEEDVYDATVETIHAFSANGLYVHNCGEIPLVNFELCNLAETFPPRCANSERFFKALEYATFYASTVSLLPTHRPETNAVIAKNRRIGVSISGVAQWASGAVPKGWGPMNYTRMGCLLRDGYKIVRNVNTRLAKEAGVPESVRVTTIKPSGSISLLAGVTPGVHYPVSRFAIRRVRIGMTSPLVEPLKAAGVPYEKDNFSEGTYVFEFVIDHGNVRQCENVSPWEQFSLVQMLQKHFSDNCVSATIYFDKEKDGADVEKMLAMFIPSLKSVSMLPHSGHGYSQAPYEPISEEEYNKRLSEFVFPVYNTVQGNVPKGSNFCSGDTCEL